MNYNIFLETELGPLEIICDETFLLEINLNTKKGREKPNDLCLTVKKQMKEYFEKKRTEFNLPIKLEGTNFQKKVWEELLKVNYGTTISYLELARKINNPKGVRAVANAVGANKLLIVVPCHRIIGTNKSMTGFGGGLENKIKLLNLEGHKIEKKVNLAKSFVTKL